MALGDVALGQRLLDGRLEVEQPQRVGYRGSGSADTSGDVVLRQTELVGELAIGVSLLHGVQVGTLYVLDDRDSKLIALGHLANDRRDVVEAGHLRRPDAALARDKLIAVEDFGDEHRLKNAVDGDAGGERLERTLLDLLAGLVRIAADPGDGNLDRSPSGGAGLRDQGPESAPESGVPLEVRRLQREPPPAGAESSLPAGAPGFSLPSRSRSSAASAA